MDHFLHHGEEYNFFYGKKRLNAKIGLLKNREIFDCLDESGRCDLGDDEIGDDTSTYESDGRTVESDGVNRGDCEIDYEDEDDDDFLSGKNTSPI